MSRRLLVLCIALMAVACEDGGGVRPNDTGALDGAADAADSGVEQDADPGSDAGPDASTCIDEDDDGYGEGCAAGPDCNDEDGNVNPGASEVCDGADNDCDDATDEALMAPSCDLTEGVCAGATAMCQGEAGFVCSAESYGDSYEVDESLCDGMDNDCDGTTDEGCACEDGATQACGTDVGVCAMGEQTCAEAAWGACVGEVAPMGESCDGMDNDCDGETDEPADLEPPACPLQLGVCAGSVRACGGVAGWVACRGIESYGGDFETEETLCDGLDNDCDGVTDEGCDCVDGATQACGSDVGACAAGTQTCISGAWGTCAEEVAPVDETCNGIDDNCDGEADNDIVAPACALQVGVCAGSTASCNGAGGFGACGAAEYGDTYEAEETACDGQDNDCDGEIDEGCECVAGETQECGLSTGACERGTQTCVAGAWGACEGAIEPTDELCDGQDNDCNGTTDDNLVAPACALTDGVCDGAVRTCAGAAGWADCTDADYGASYAAVETGDTAPALCDGLDNDCDGAIDDDCSTVPLLTDDRDIYQPFLRNDHLVFAGSVGGQSEIFFFDLGSGDTIRVTNTPENERFPRVYGNQVVFTRDVGGEAMLFHYNLVTGTESALGTEPGNGAWIHRDLIVYDQVTDTSAEIRILDALTGTDSMVVSGLVAPTIRYPHVTGVASDGVWVANLDTGDTRTAMSTTNMRVPIDDSIIVWNDAGNLNGSGLSMGSTIFPMFDSVTSTAATDAVFDTSGSVFVFHREDASFGVFLGVLEAGVAEIINDDSFVSAQPTVSGAEVVWSDNRMGSFNLFYTSHSGIAEPNAGSLRIVEILADPPAGSDANGDGTSSTTEDEFIEIVNATRVTVDLSNLEITDATGVRHTFPANARSLPAGASIVVFAGGTPTGRFAGSQTVTASTGSLGLNNGGDTVTIRTAAGVEIDSVTYTGVSDESVQLVGGEWIPHSTATDAIGPMSPGSSWDGRAF